MCKVEGVILDWAGTTVDYGCFAPVHVFEKIFRQRGIVVTEAEIRKPMGMRKRDHIKSMLAMERIAALWKERYGCVATEEDVDALYTSFEPQLLAALRDYAVPKPNVAKTVAVLRERGVKIGSTTGYTDAMLRIVAAEAAVQGYAPDAWVTPDSTGQCGRPYPYMIFRNMEMLRLEDVRGVVKVGDTLADIEEGKRAGVWSVGVVEGSSMLGMKEAQFAALPVEEKAALRARAVKQYRKAGVDFVIDGIEDIFSVIAAIESS